MYGNTSPLSQVPFNSSAKYMVTMHECNPTIEPETRSFFHKEADNVSRNLI